MEEVDDIAALSIAFGIDFKDSVLQMKSLDDIIGKTAADAVREFQKIQKAAACVNTDAAAAQMREGLGMRLHEHEDLPQCRDSGQ